MSTENLKLFSEKVRTRRKTLRLTLREVASAVGVSTSAVAGWERGESYPKRGSEQRVAEILQSDRSWLFGVGEHPEEEEISEENMNRLRVLAELSGKSIDAILSHMLRSYGTRTVEEMKRGANSAVASAETSALSDVADHEAKHRSR